MIENTIGQFIAQMRKEKNMTQKELAEHLHITDKAVSKWERGLSCPDITLLTAIADILGVTTSELLNGAKEEVVSPTDKNMDKTVDKALSYAEKTSKKKIADFLNIAAAAFSASLLLGIAVCIICDLAITGHLTWSLYVISSCIFTWMVFFPLIKNGSKGILRCLISLSVLLIPFLFVLSRIIGEDRFMKPISLIVSPISLAWIWLVYLIWKRIWHRKLHAAAYSLLSSLPFSVAINISISLILGEPVFDVWDILNYVLILLLAGALFFAAGRKSRAV